MNSRKPYTKLKLFLILISTTLGLTGCATISSPINNAALDDATIVLVPTGKVQLSGISSRLGGSFGIIGALIEATVTKNEMEGKSDAISEAITDKIIFDVVGNELQKGLLLSAKPKQVVQEARTLPNAESSEWFKPEFRQYAPTTTVSGRVLILDYGVSGVSINQTLLYGAYLTISMQMRLIDPTTGKVIARAAEITRPGEEKITADRKEVGDVVYAREVSEATKRLLAKLTQSVVKRLIS